ncbi:MAG: hypothetical protein QM831_44785 [Kofleriaceae bacterium]
MKIALAAMLLGGCLFETGEPNDPDYATQYQMIVHLSAPQAFHGGWVRFDYGNEIGTFSISDPAGVSSYDFHYESPRPVGMSSIAFEAECCTNGDGLAGFLLDQTYVEKTPTLYKLEVSIALQHTGS